MIRPKTEEQETLEVAYSLELLPGRSPTLRVLERSVPKGEGAPLPGPYRACRVRRSVERFPEKSDRLLIAALVELRGDAEMRAKLLHADPEDELSLVQKLSRSTVDDLLPRLGATGRLRVRTKAAGLADDLYDLGPTIGWLAEPLRFRMRATIAPDAPDVWEVRGALLHDAFGELTASDVTAHVETLGLVLVRGNLARVDDGGAASWLGMLIAHPTMRITPSRRAAFLDELFAATTSPPLDLPPGVAIAETAEAPVPRLFVHAVPAPAGALFAELSFAYGNGRAPIRAGAMCFDLTRNVLVPRDAVAERAEIDRALALGLEPIVRALIPPPPMGSTHTLPAARLASIASELTQQGFVVEAAGREYRRAKAWTARVESGKDWFELRGEVDYDGRTVQLSAVLAALRAGKEGVALDDGSVGLLPEVWMSRHALLRLGEARGEGLRFKRSQLAIVAEIAGASPEVRLDKTFAAARDAIAANAIVAMDPPSTFRGELRPYQREGLGWLTALDRAGVGGLLADDMGLGKTVQLLAFLAGLAGRARGDGPALVVAPRSLVFNWKREAARFAPNLRVLDHSGADRRPPGDHFRELDLVLTTYGTLRRDVEAFANVPLGALVLDEAQAIKNESSETARAVRRLRAERRFALSGTPIENHLGELWSIFEVINPGMLGGATAWRAATEAKASPEAIAALGRALRPFMLRRTKARVAPDLPARSEESLEIELDPEDRALYDELRNRFRDELLGRVPAKGLGAASARVLEALLRLRQVACDARLIDPKRTRRGAKLDALIPRLVALRESGQKALVFSQFRSLLDLARPELEAEGLRCDQIDGSTRDREGVVARFQGDDACDVLLISLKAGGVGLNLTAAEYVFLLDPWWNPAAEAQAIDRAHRIGQQKPVFAYRMIAKDTVEERIAELQQHKRALAESVIEGDGAPLLELGAEDLSKLLS
jgi:superfamily II DNA or RNA helicase